MLTSAARALLLLALTAPSGPPDAPLGVPVGASVAGVDTGAVRRDIPRPAAAPPLPVGSEPPVSPVGALPLVSPVRAPAPVSPVSAVAPVSPASPVSRFAPGPYPWSRGHRGTDLDAASGAPVRAVAAGVVTVARPVAGVPVVTVDHGGLRTTYLPVLASVSEGQRVVAGQRLGQLGPGPAHPGSTSGGGSSGTVLHWGAIGPHGYLDPLRLLAGGATLVPVPAGT